MTASTGERAPQAQREPSEIFDDLFGGVVMDPFPLYDELREIGDGIHFSELLQSYVVTRHADARRIGSDHRTFSSDIFAITPAGIHDPNDPEHLRFATIASRLFMLTDPPVHTRIRSTFRAAFTPDAVKRWEPTIAQATKELLDDYQVGQEVDIMPRFAADVPVAVVAAVLGVPREAWSKFREWSFGYASTFDPLVQGERRDAAIRTSLELFDYLAELIDARRAEPQEDLITTLVEAETIDGDRMETAEMLAQVALLLVAGNETTTNLIGNGLTLLFDNPEARAALAADSSLIPRAVEEMLRIDPPLHITMRRVTQEVTIGDHTIPEGAVVAPCIVSANRDPRVFEDPNAFDIHRDSSKHLAFYHGIHFCVGAPLARMEGLVVFEEILKRFPDIRPGSEPAIRRTLNAVSRGWETRPVQL